MRTMQMKTFRIAIDGPSGAGKSTVAKAVAKRLGFLQVDTGAMYRSIGLYVYEHKKDPDDKAAVIACLPDISIDLGFSDEGQRIYLNGRDVSDDIRQNVISLYASKVSAIPEVRAFLLGMQRKVASEHDVVMDGRDIGTVILPDAELKIFQTASVKERAKRRFDELTAKGQTVSLDDIKREITERDYNDSHRAEAPCVPADDAVIIDNSNITIEENTEIIALLYEMRK